MEMYCNGNWHISSEVVNDNCHVEIISWKCSVCCMFTVHSSLLLLRPFVDRIFPVGRNSNRIRFMYFMGRCGNFKWVRTATVELTMSGFKVYVWLSRMFLRLVNSLGYKPNSPVSWLGRQISRIRRKMLKICSFTLSLGYFSAALDVYQLFGAIGDSFFKSATADY